MTPDPASPTIGVLATDGDGEMGIMHFLEIVALGAMVWLLFKIDAKLQSIGDTRRNFLQRLDTAPCCGGARATAFPR